MRVYLSVERQLKLEKAAERRDETPEEYLAQMLDQRDDDDARQDSADVPPSQVPAEK